MAAGAGIAGASHSLTWQQSCGLSAVAGVGKEAYDSTGRGTVDPMDAVATIAIGCGIAWMLDQ